MALKALYNQYSHLVKGKDENIFLFKCKSKYCATTAIMQHCRQLLCIFNPVLVLVIYTALAGQNKYGLHNLHRKRPQAHFKPMLTPFTLHYFLS